MAGYVTGAEMGRAVQVPVEVRMRSYELRARMYRMERMMRRQSTGQRAHELAPCGAATSTSSTTTATANATSASARSAMMVLATRRCALRRGMTQQPAVIRGEIRRMLQLQRMPRLPLIVQAFRTVRATVRSRLAPLALGPTLNARRSATATVQSQTRRVGDVASCLRSPGEWRRREAEDAQDGPTSIKRGQEKCEEDRKEPRVPRGGGRTAAAAAAAAGGGSDGGGMA
ncbi:hypothetical protein DBV15_03172 [Temnothorax longispinosus]|uniref:Uncharacterized protein n=1 Tax=Temnothorax longispinosus TaxID=300112 RepID=A0A4V3SB21_9HYME|nr:hypothetical protein DBV15_03172 [Temnothorax longispinosus]